MLLVVKKILWIIKMFLVLRIKMVLFRTIHGFLGESKMGLLWQNPYFGAFILYMQKWFCMVASDCLLLGRKGLPLRYSGP